MSTWPQPASGVPLRDAAPELFGRDRETAHLLELLTSPAVPGVLLTGPPHIGKTSLASALADAYAAVTGADVILLDGSLTAGPAPAVDRFVGPIAAHRRRTGGPPPLLVADDLDPAGHRAVGAAARLHGVRVIGTSRRDLPGHGLVRHPVGPLPVPLSCSALDLRATALNPSVQLYVAALRAINPAFSLRPHNQLATARICVEVRGVPGALLWAGHVAALEGPEALWAALGQPRAGRGVRRRPLSPVAARAPRPVRPATGPEPINSAASRLLQCGAVFAGGFGPEALREVSGLPPAAFQEGLQSLLGEDLLQLSALPSGRLDGVSRARLHLPPTAQSPATPAVGLRRARIAHARYYARLAHASAARINHGGQGAGLPVFRTEERNIRAALATLLDEELTGEALDLADDVSTYWHAMGALTAWPEGPSEPPAVPDGSRDMTRLRLLLAEASVRTGQPEAALALLGRLAETETETETDAEAADLPARRLHVKGLAEVAAGTGGGTFLLHQAAALHRSAGDHPRADRATLEAAMAAFLNGDTAAATASVTDLLPMAVCRGDVLTVGTALLHLSVFAAADGRAEAADGYCDRALTHLRMLGTPALLGALATTLGTMLLPDTTERARRVAYVLGCFHTARAAVPAEPAEPDFTACEMEDQVRGLLGDTAFHRALDEGAAATFPDLIRRFAAGFGPAGASVAARPDPRSTTPLTPRQTEVALLVSQGLSNKQIARRLEISEWTVVNHIRETMRKLDCTSRVEIAGWIHHTATPPRLAPAAAACPVESLSSSCTPGRPG